MPVDQSSQRTKDEAKSEHHHLPKDNHRVYSGDTREYCGPPVSSQKLNDPRYVPPIGLPKAPGLAANVSAHSAPQSLAARPNRSLAHSSGPTPQQNLHYELALQQPRQQQHNTSYGSINQNSQPNISAKHCAPNQTDEEYWRHKRDQRNRLERSHKQENLPFAGREPSRGNGDEEEDEEDGEKGDGNP